MRASPTRVTRRLARLASVAALALCAVSCLSFPASTRCAGDADCAADERCEPAAGRCIAATGDSGQGGAGGVTGDAAAHGGTTDASHGGTTDASHGGATDGPLGGGTTDGPLGGTRDAGADAGGGRPADVGSGAPDLGVPPPEVLWRQVSAGGSLADRGVSSGYETGSGNGHTCALTRDDRLFCWGANGDGQLGIGAATGRRFATPQAVQPDARWASVSAGLIHTCAIRADADSEAPGALFCWGDSGWGRLGIENADLLDTSTPRRVGVLSDWRQVSAGGGHTCAIRGNAGLLYCWGARGYGQVGLALDPGQFQADEPLPLPGDGYEKVAASLLHSCALRAGGHVECWGVAEYGRTGHGDSETATCDNGLPCIATPREIVDVGPWSEVVTGDEHTCALRPDGRVSCWGANYDLAAGLPDDVTFTASPTEVETQVSALDAGGRTTCLRSAEYSYCFGLGWAGQRGSGFPDDLDFEYVRGPVAPPAGETWADVSVGGEHTCMLTEAGHLYCFGSTFDGQVGANHFSGADEPTASPFAGRIERLAVGYERSACALSAGDVYCWGDGNSGLFLQEGRPSSGLPLRLTMTGDYVELGVGLEFACAQRGETGQFETLCWGRGDSGQLGTGVDPVENGRAYTVPPLGTDSPTHLSLGAAHACRLSGDQGAALAADCWGINPEGQLGPLAIDYGPWAPTPLSSPLPLTKVAAGGVATYAIDTSGALIRWGAIRSIFELGDVVESERLLEPMRLGMDSDWLDISASGDRLCGIRAGAGPDARVLFCADLSALDEHGDELRQALGGQVQGRPGPWRAVAAGFNVVFALDDEGRLYSTGANLYGQNGDGHRYSREPNQLRAIGGALRFSAVAAGDGFACAVSQGAGDLDGRLHCWGLGHRGQTALGESNPSVPQRVVDPLVAP